MVSDIIGHPVLVSVEISDIAIKGITLSKQQIIDVDWNLDVLICFSVFTYGINRLSHGMAQLITYIALYYQV